VWREGWGEERRRDSDMERDEYDPLDNSPMLALSDILINFPNREHIPPGTTITKCHNRKGEGKGRLLRPIISEITAAIRSRNVNFNLTVIRSLQQLNILSRKRTKYCRK